MPFLDVLHLFFNSSATIEDDASIFGKEWQVALQYVLRQPGLEAIYTSRLSEKHDLWAFLGELCAHVVRSLLLMHNQYGRPRTIEATSIIRVWDLGFLVIA